jgi:NAD-dependent SIR2 family protein deacetylase
METKRVGHRCMIQAVCKRCGANFEYDSKYLARPTYDPSKCNDCKRVPASYVYYGSEACRSWQGHYDEDDNPIKDGKLYKPGVRTCGHKDCVRKDHIIPSKSHTDRTEVSVQGASTSSPNGPQRKSA